MPAVAELKKILVTPDPATGPEIDPIKYAKADSHALLDLKSNEFHTGIAIRGQEATVLGQIASDATLTPDQKTKLTAFLPSHISRLLTDEAARLSAFVSSVNTRLAKTAPEEKLGFSQNATPAPSQADLQKAADDAVKGLTVALQDGKISNTQFTTSQTALNGAVTAIMTARSAPPPYSPAEFAALYDRVFKTDWFEAIGSSEAKMQNHGTDVLRDQAVANGIAALQAEHTKAAAHFGTNPDFTTIGTQITKLATILGTQAGRDNYIQGKAALNELKEYLDPAKNKDAYEFFDVNPDKLTRFGAAREGRKADAHLAAVHARLDNINTALPGLIPDVNAMKTSFTALATRVKNGTVPDPVAAAQPKGNNQPQQPRTHGFKAGLGRFWRGTVSVLKALPLSMFTGGASGVAGFFAAKIPFFIALGWPGVAMGTACGAACFIATFAAQLWK